MEDGVVEGGIMKPNLPDQALEDNNDYGPIFSPKT